MTDADTVRDGLHPGRETSGNPFEALSRLLARVEQAERERDEWREKYDAEKINWHRLYEDFRAVERERDTLREALEETAVYIALVRAARHGTPTHDDCPRCKSDQRELDRIGAALTAVSPPQEGEA